MTGERAAYGKHRLSRLEGTYEQVDRRLNSIDGRLNSIDERLNLMDARFGARIDGLDQKIDQRFMWTMAGIATSWVTIILTVVFHH